MNLEEFRKSLESDATIENKKLKVEIENLKKAASARDERAFTRKKCSLR